MNLNNFANCLNLHNINIGFYVNKNFHKWCAIAQILKLNKRYDITVNTGHISIIDKLNNNVICIATPQAQNALNRSAFIFCDSDISQEEQIKIYERIVSWKDYSL